MNQAEVIHAGWAHKDPSNLSLLDAAHTDTRDSVLFVVELFSRGLQKVELAPLMKNGKQNCTAENWEGQPNLAKK